MWERDRERLLRTMEAAVDAFPWEVEESYADYLAQSGRRGVRPPGASPSLAAPRTDP